MKHLFLYKKTTSTVSLTSIGSSATSLSNILFASIVDKFLLVSATAALVGVSCFGAALLLHFGGESRLLRLLSSFENVRRAHAYVLFYLFFGLAIIGFLLQAAPRFLQLPFRPKASALWLIPLSLFGVICSCISDTTLSRCLLTLPFLWTLCSIVMLLVETSFELRLRFGGWILFSLSGFISAPQFGNSGAVSWVLIFWWAVAPMIIGVGQQFLLAFVSGKLLDLKKQLCGMSLFLATLVLFVVGYFNEHSMLIRAGGMSAELLLVGYSVSSSIWNPKKWIKKEILGLAFSLSYLWACVGALLLVVGGEKLSDGALHAWTLGWATPLLFTICFQILQSFAGALSISRKWQLVLLLFWQIVPIGRVALSLGVFPRGVAHLVVFVSTGVLMFWGYWVFLAAKAIYLRSRLK